jgi:hypothetical protein
MAPPSKPCRRCGGPKDRGIRGAQYCQACHEELQPIWQQKERERSSAKGLNTRRAAGIPTRAKKYNDEGNVWCRRCADYLPIHRFGLKNGKPATYCRRCYKTYAHENRLKRIFDVSPEDYNRLLDIQEGRCAICRDRPVRRFLAVDHDHHTGKIRGLLCKRCNKDLLGSARDSTEILERAICYLESPPADTGLPVVIHEDFERDAAMIRRFGDHWGVVWEVDQFILLLRQAIANKQAREATKP